MAIKPADCWPWRRSPTGSRGDAAEIGGVGLQTARDWVLRFNAEGPAGLVNGKAPGSRPLPGEVERAPLRRIAEEGPTTSVHVVQHLATSVPARPTSSGRIFASYRDSLDPCCFARNSLIDQLRRIAFLRQWAYGS